MSQRRDARIAEQLQREISRMILEEIKDPRMGMVTISGVRVSEDHQYARVYFSVFGTEDERKQTQQALRSASGFIRGRLSRMLRMKTMPELSFILDNSLDHVERIAQLLHDLETTRPSEDGATEDSSEAEHDSSEAEDDSSEAEHDSSEAEDDSSEAEADSSEAEADSSEASADS